jgi:hypothetical protein
MVQRVQVLMPQGVQHMVLVTQRIKQSVMMVMIAGKRVATACYRRAGRNQAADILLFLASIDHHYRHHGGEKQEFLHKDFR